VKPPFDRKNKENLLVSPIEYPILPSKIAEFFAKNEINT